MKEVILISMMTTLLAPFFVQAKTAMLEGIFTSLPDAGFEKNVFIHPLMQGNGKAEINGEGYLTGAMSADDKLLLESYFFWEEGSLSKADCLSFPAQQTTQIEEIAASNGDDAAQIASSYLNASAYLDKKNAEALFPLPKYKTRQVLCISSEGKHFPQTSASIFFYNAQVGVIPMLKQ
ncbi:hypothetical protein BCT30_24145 [Enterovibrio norvegicus]|uniref:hypothetical protein n=1 Tax=Enterovibrio norvegicus TaxID=188144 RepID=UPI000C825B39|nr:hypothetical protein [Enterovibrio norvegicus]MCC4801021.1 hypothetical protein [Enterovibrio norvegicus]PMI26614.1 hypothetical protein BCU47_23165 [Enterovibrio norvegicus]PMI36882.1 hypothetical protein BCU46_12555 [Enterovibrio norvegicus]PMN55582.1 hypothetical protein BCT30_24145 [Enterovibrio norvegicus]